MRYFFTLQKFFSSSQMPHFSSSCPTHPSNLVNFWSRQFSASACMSTQKKKKPNSRVQRFAQSLLEKHFRRSSLYVGRPLENLSLYSRLLIKMFTQQKPGLMEKRYHSASKKIKCSPYHCTEEDFSQVQKVERDFREGNGKSRGKKLYKWTSHQVFGEQQRVCCG